jgi:SurA N-terminal domain
VRRAAAVALTLVLAVLVTGLLVGRGGGDKTVAHVGGEAITEDQLDAVVEHFRLEAKAEGTTFPDEGSPAFRRIQSRLLGLLVYRAELRQAARRLGVEVSRVQVLKRMGASSADEEASRDAFEYGSAEAQLLFEAIFRKVTRGVTAPTQAELAARRNEAMARYVGRLRRETKVRYEPGFGPGS